MILGSGFAGGPMATPHAPLGGIASNASLKALVRKTASVFEFSLCLSRACLGKMFVFIYKWLKNAVFRRLRWGRSMCR
jgi:hypothetical protein